MVPQDIGRARRSAARRRWERRDSGSFATSLLTLSLLLLMTAFGFVFGRVVIARAYVRTTADLKRAQTEVTPRGQAATSGGIAGGGELGGEQADLSPVSDGSGGTSSMLPPREEVRPAPPGDEEEHREGQVPETGTGGEASGMENARYAIQVGAFGSKDSARAAASRLTRARYAATIEVDREHDVYRVLTGEYRTEESARSALEEVRAEGFPEAFVIIR